MRKTPTFILDDETRRPMVRLLVDVVLQAFGEGVNASNEDAQEQIEDYQKKQKEDTADMRRASVSLDAAAKTIEYLRSELEESKATLTSWVEAAQEARQHLGLAEGIGLFDYIKGLPHIQAIKEKCAKDAAKWAWETPTYDIGEMGEGDIHKNLRIALGLPPLEEEKP